MDKFQDTTKDINVYKEFVEGRKDSDVVLIGVDNLKWLIEQAEKVRQLQAENKILNEIIEGHNRTFEEIREMLKFHIVIK